MAERIHYGVRAALVLWLCALAGLPAAADVYKYRDRAGHIYLTDEPMRGSGYQLLERIQLGGGRGAPDLLERRRARLSPLIERVARAHRLHPELLHAVIRAESAYDPEAVSSKGAVGLMQLMPETARRYGARDRRDPQENLSAGARYLSELLARFGDDLELALAAYNAGENAVVRYGNRVPPFAETQGYVHRVLRFYRQRVPAAPRLVRN